LRRGKQQSEEKGISGKVRRGGGRSGRRGKGRYEGDERLFGDHLHLSRVDSVVRGNLLSGLRAEVQGGF
jgi:hypothetical protein